MTIGQRLKKARKHRGITQEMLAKQIGASRGVITNIEHDKIGEPQPIVINAICSVLQINKEWLLNNHGDMVTNVASDRSTQILSEIYYYAQELSEEEQLFILDMIKAYAKHLK